MTDWVLATLKTGLETDDLTGGRGETNIMSRSGNARETIDIR